MQHNLQLRETVGLNNDTRIEIFLNNEVIYTSSPIDFRRYEEKELKQLLNDVRNRAKLQFEKYLTLLKLGYPKVTIWNNVDFDTERKITPQTENRFNPYSPETDLAVFTKEVLDGIEPGETPFAWGLASRSPSHFEHMISMEKGEDPKPSVLKWVAKKYNKYSWQILYCRKEHSWDVFNGMDYPPHTVISLPKEMVSTLMRCTDEVMNYYQNI